MASHVDEDVVMEDEPYISSEDEDFDPLAANAEEEVSSDSGEEDATAPSTATKGPKQEKKKPRKKKDDEAEDLGFENSGDEATIRKGTKRKRKGRAADDEESGGEGGFVKTRSMRAVESKEKKPLANANGATIDVDALWKTMNTKDASTSLEPPTPAPTMQEPDATTLSASNEASNTQPPPAPSEELITISRTYKFAGEVHHETKQVPKSSAEAQLYLETNPDAATTTAVPSPQKLKPLRRISKWDPNPEGIVRGLPSLETKGPQRRLKVVDKSKLDWPKPQRLNVVEKSKLDWVAHVDAEGQREELEMAAKAKDGYLARKDFLGRVEATREEALRNARTK